MQGNFEKSGIFGVGKNGFGIGLNTNGTGSLMNNGLGIGMNANGVTSLQNINGTGSVMNDDTSFGAVEKGINFDTVVASNDVIETSMQGKSGLKGTTKSGIRMRNENSFDVMSKADIVSCNQGILETPSKQCNKNAFEDVSKKHNQSVLEDPLPRATLRGQSSFASGRKVTFDNTFSNKKIICSKEQFLRILFACLIVTVASLANVFGVMPFGAAALLGLIMLGFQVYYLLPFYMGVSLAYDYSVANIIAVSCIGVGAVVLAVCRTKKFYVAEIVYFIFSCGGIYGIIQGQNYVSWLAGVLLGSLSLIAFLHMRGESNLSDICKCAVACVMGCGLYKYTHLGMLVFGCALMWLIRSNNRFALVYAILFAVGELANTLEVVTLAQLAGVAAIAKVFERNKYVSCVAAVICVVVFAFFFNVALYSAVALCIGLIAGSFIPLARASVKTVKKITLPVIRKMQVAANACRGLHFDLDEEKLDMQMLAANFGTKLCDGCKNYAQCKVDSDSVETAVGRAIETRKTGLGVLPDEFLEQCQRASDAPKVLKEIIKDYECNMLISDVRTQAAKLVGHQLEAFSQLLSDFTSDSVADILVDAEQERKARGVIEASGAKFDTMCHAGDEKEMHVIAHGASEETVVKALKASTGREYVIERITLLDEGSEFVLKPTPKFKVMFGVKQVAKTGNICGDTYIVKRLNAGTILAVLCDGMGSGRAAHDLSKRTVRIMEACFTAGFRTESVLKLINSLLSLCGDRFSCVDICVIDLEIGQANFIKMGGVESVLVRGKETLKIDGGALPLGVAKLPVPAISNIAIHSGDLIVMATDGVTDRCKLASKETNNPQAAAEEIIKRARENGSGNFDDMTALVLRAV